MMESASELPPPETSAVLPVTEETVLAVLHPPTIVPKEEGQNGVEQGEEEVAGGSGVDGDEEGEEEDDDSPSASQCLDDPHFATICSFMDKFGPLLRLDVILYDDLQAMLECTTMVPEPLLKLHIVLLRRVFKSIAADKWERSLAKFCHFYSNQDGWEIERFGYKNAKLQTKLRLLKNLLEAQFDFNVKFKAEVNKLEAGDLRLVPLGQDCEGQLYWYQVDGDANLRIYREDVDDESWEVVACTRKGLCELITKLQLGDVKRHQESEGLLLDEDSNEKEIEVKEILRDTGKFVEEEDDEEDTSCDSEVGKLLEVKKRTEKEETDEIKPSVIKTEVATGSETIKIEKEKVVKMEVDDEIASETLSGSENKTIIEKEESQGGEESVSGVVHVKNEEIEDVNEGESNKSAPLDEKLEIDGDLDHRASAQPSREAQIDTAPSSQEPSLLVAESEITQTSQSHEESAVVDSSAVDSNPQILPEVKPVEEPLCVKKDAWICGDAAKEPSAKENRIVEEFTKSEGEGNGATELTSVAAPETETPQENKPEPPVLAEESIVGQEQEVTLAQPILAPLESVPELNTKETELPPTSDTSSALPEPVETVLPTPLPQTDETIPVIAPKPSENNQPCDLPQPLVDEPVPIEDNSGQKQSPSSKMTIIPPQSPPIEEKALQENAELSEPSPPLETTSSVSAPQTDLSISSQEPKQSTESLPLSVSTQPDQSSTSLPTTMPIKKPNPLGSLVSYGASSDDEDESESEDNKPAPPAPKRKAPHEEDLQPTKLSRVDPLNPIVGEAVEEPVLFITGQGAGAPCEGGNDNSVLENNQKENVAEPPPAESNAGILPSVKRGRGRPGKKSGATSPPKKQQKNNDDNVEFTPTKKTPTPRGRKRRELEQLGVPLDALEVNGDGGGGSNERPVRASRRIAQIRLKEEEERRHLEEEQLAELKAAQLRKQQKKAEGGGGCGEGKKSKSLDPSGTTYLPSSSSSSSASDGDEEGDDFANPSSGKKKKRKRKKKKPGKPGRPWATDSSDNDEEGVEEEEEYHYEEEDHDHDHLHFNDGSDHEFSPESDLGEDDRARPSRHARTAKRGEIEAEEETGCKKCGKGDHPEWILLCDKCDHGWHASCLRPQLWVIPEGEWFCPPCQHRKLVAKLNENLIEYDKLLKHRENDVLKKKRLTFVGISLENVLPDDQVTTNIDKPSRDHKSSSPSRKHRDRDRSNRKSSSSRRRRIILSDEEISDNFIASDDNSSSVEKSNNSLEDEDSDGPIYRLRARRTAKKFDYKEYDDMINSACRASDEEEYGEMLEEGAALDNGQDVDEDAEEVEEEEEETSGGGGGGKNAAYEQHLKEAEEKVKADATAAKAAATSEKENDEKKVKVLAAATEEDTDEEGLTEKEKKRRRELKKNIAGSKRKKRSFRNLEDFSDEDASDEDFRGSDVEDDEDGDEDVAEEDESDWSGDKDDDSDDSLAAAAKRGKKGKYGRKDEYLEVGAVRRSTRTAKRKSRISYDESDAEDDEEEEEGADKWNSDQSEEDEETPSESDDETYGKVKRKKPPRKSSSSTPRFLLGANSSKQGGLKKRSGSGGGGSKKKRKAVDDEEVDRAWRGSGQGSKAKRAAEEKVERRTRGRKINFKDILESGESDDDGNVLPKRRRLSDGEEDEDEAEASRRLAEKIKAENQRQAAQYAARKRKEALAASGEVEENDADTKQASSDQPPASVPEPDNEKDTPIKAEGELLSKILTSEPPPPVITTSAPTPSALEMELALAKPVPAPPLPPLLAKALGRGSKNKKKSVPLSDEKGLEKKLMEPLPPPMHPESMPVPPNNSKKNNNKSSSSAHPPIPHHPSQPPTSSSSMSPMQGHNNSPQHNNNMPPGMPLDISRVPNPGLFPGGNSNVMRPFHPMWPRNPGPPPYGLGPSPPTSIGKPPPLSNSPFLPQHPSVRPSYPPSGPPLRIPNPSSNNPALQQAFQHFQRRDGGPPGPGGMYRPPPPSSGLPPGLLAGFQNSPERFFGAHPSPYGPYGMLPPQGQQGFFGPTPFDPFRPAGSETFKDDNPPPPRPTPTRPGPTSTSSPPQPHPGLHPHTPHSNKDDAILIPPSETETEFGGLVSYFSSQRSEEDMDT